MRHTKLLFGTPWLSMALVACAVGAGTTGGSEAGLDFTLVSGEGCADGCELDRPLMATTVERYLLTGAFALDDLVASSSSSEIAFGVIEPVSLCSDGLSTRVVSEPADCAAEVFEEPVLTVHARGVGAAEVRVHVGTVQAPPIASLSLRIEAADIIVARPAELPSHGAYVPIRVVRLTPGESVALGLDVWAAEPSWHRLHASTRIGAIVGDLAIVGLGEGGLDLAQRGDRIRVTGRRPGTSLLWLRAPERAESIEVRVGTECQRAGTCELPYRVPDAVSFPRDLPAL